MLTEHRRLWGRIPWGMEMNRRLRRITRRICRSEPARRTGRVATAVGIALLVIVAGAVTWAALTRF